jgi:putative Mg2+ transporter-C (MgtC) family protein
VNNNMSLLEHTAVGLVLAYTFGYERKLRGAPAGERTFAIIGAAAALMTAAVGKSSPQAVAGIISGIGFIGGGVVLHADGTMVRGITTAASIYAVAILGVVAGYGYLLDATVVTAGMILMAESNHAGIFKWLDPGKLARRFEPDSDHLNSAAEAAEQPTRRSE